MAWTTPKTWVAGEDITLSDLHTYIRDNLNEVETAKATAAGQLLVTSGANSVAMRTVQSSYADATVTTSSTSPTTLGSGTPSVSVTHGGAMWIFWAARFRYSAGTASLVNCGPEVVGKYTARDNSAIRLNDSQRTRFMGGFFLFGLTAGTDTVRLNYWVNSGSTTGEYAQRAICVIPL